MLIKAQIRQGRMMVTGNLSGSTTNFFDESWPVGSEHFRSNTITTLASVGYFVTSRLAVGLDVDFTYSYLHNEVYVINGTKLTQISRWVTPGFFARWNFPVGNKFNFYVEPSLGFGFRKSYTSIESPSSQPPPIAETDTRYKTFDITILGGVNYFINDNFALDCRPGYFRWMRTQEQGDEHPRDTVEMGMLLRGLTFGVIYLFPK
jgi:hypothetical protein